MKKRWSFVTAMLMAMAIMVMSGCGGGGGGPSSGSTNTGGGGGDGGGGGSTVTAFTTAMVSGKTVAMTIQGVSRSSTFVLNADGTWTGTSAFNEALLGTWSVNSSGKLVVLNKASFTGATYDTTTITVTSGTLPALSANIITTYTDGSPNDSGSATLVISTTASAGTYSISGTITSGGTALAGVTVTCSDNSLASATTDTNGNYTISGLTNGSYTLTPTKTDHTFSPTTLVATVSSANLTGKNFAATTTATTAVTVSTLAGVDGMFGSTDSTGSAALFHEPTGIATDGTNLFVADSQNNTIRKVVIATRVVSTLAGSAGLTGSTDGTGAAARFYYPQGITTDGTNLFVADSQNNTIRKVVIATRVVSTLAGSAGLTGSTDGTGAAARFYYPQGITTDGTNLFVADNQNSTIRKVVIATGVVTTLAGSAGLTGSIDGTGTAARFAVPIGITTDGTNLYVTESNGNSIYSSINTVRKVVIATGAVTTLAGYAGPQLGRADGSAHGSTDGTGSAALFYNPTGIATDGTNLFVTDNENETIRKIVIATGVVTTLAGSAGSFGSADGTGAAARFCLPRGIASFGGKLYIADTFNDTIRLIQ